MRLIQMIVVVALSFALLTVLFDNDLGTYFERTYFCVVGMLLYHWNTDRPHA